MKKLLLLPVSPPETNFTLSFEVFCLKGFPNVFTKQMFSLLGKLVSRKFALVYIHAIFLLSHTKHHMLVLIEHVYQLCSSRKIILCPSHRKIFRHKIGNNTN